MAVLSRSSEPWVLNGPSSSSSRKASNHPHKEILSRPAGSLLPRAAGNGEVMVVLARRTERVPHHKGQVCFPGGSRDPGDADLFATALREAEEELGSRGGGGGVLGGVGAGPAGAGFFIQPDGVRVP